jgi:FOG: CheY-like receiver
MIPNKIKILLVEDNKVDAELIEHQIKKILAYPEIMQVDSFYEFEQAMAIFQPDILLSDYQLNEFTGLEVLRYVQKTHTHIPFIFITGTINNEELAAQSILTGATGYFLKKNINELHKKLLPHFEKLVDNNEPIELATEHKIFYKELQLYMKSVFARNEIMKSEYQQMKEVLKKIKSKNK